MNSIYHFLNSHVSVRHFTKDVITDEDEAKIVSTSQQSPTSSNLQAYSIVGIREQERKEKISSLSGNQQHIIDSSLFLVFCADLNRLKRLNDEKGYDFYGDTMEMLLLATVDCSLVASRALMAAQSLGIGGVMVGSIRNNPDDVSTLLKLPDLVYPVMGMSLGFPAKSPDIKPRLAIDAIYHKEVYSNNKTDKLIAEYDVIIDKLSYLKDREVQPEKYLNFNGTYSWSEHTARRMANEKSARLHMMEFLNRKGFVVR
jgi:nitroreductase